MQRSPLEPHFFRLHQWCLRRPWRPWRPQGQQPRHHRRSLPRQLPADSPQRTSSNAAMADSCLIDPNFSLHPPKALMLNKTHIFTFPLPVSILERVVLSGFVLGKRGSNHFDPHDDVARIFLVRATPDFAISFAIAAEFSISTPLSRQLLAPFAPTCPLWA